MNDDEKHGYGELAARLRKLRLDAGVSGADLAAGARMSQSKISRIERGLARPAEHEIEAIAAVLALDQVTVAELKNHVRALDQFEVASNGLGGSVETVQQEVYGIERLATQIDKFVTQIMPGILQTREYADAVFRSLRDISMADFEDFVIRSVVLRMQRQTELYDMRKTFRILVTNSSLFVNFGGDEVMQGQLQALLAVERPNVELRILDTSQPLPYGHTHIFDLFDRRIALAESLFTVFWIHDPRQVELLANTFDRMWELADSGAAAKARIERALEYFTARIDDGSDAELDVRAHTQRV